MKERMRFIERAGLVVVTASAAALMVGCSSSGPAAGISGAAAAGGTGAGGGGAAGSGGMAGAGGFVPDADGGACVEPAGFTGRERCAPGMPGGYVELAQQIFRISSAPNTAFSGLHVDLESPPPAADLPCATEAFGSCVVYTCTSPPGREPNADAAVPALLSAGVITVSSAGNVLSETPDAMPPSPAAVNAPFFADGGRLDFDATGGDVPAFHDDLCGPPRIVFTQPSAAAAALPIDRSQDLTLRWTNGGTAGVLTVSITQGSASTPPVKLECNWDPSLGEGVIPSQALMKLPSAPTGFDAYLIVRKPVTAGGTCVELTASNMAAPLTQ